MLKKILIIIILYFSIFSGNTLANNEINPVAKKWFTDFSKKINSKYSTDYEIKYFESLGEKLDNIKIIKKLNNSQISLINDLIILSNEYTFTLHLQEIEKSNKIILKTNKLINDFSNFSYNNEHIFLENGVWYAYYFENYLTFPKNANITKNDLEYNGINAKKDLVFLKEDNRLGFSNSYIKRKLISDSIIYGIPGKFNFLKEIKDDKKKLAQETDIAFKTLKEKTINLTDGKTKSEKIQIIYKYVLENVQYSNNFTLNDSEIFSGIHTFINKDGVCEGYVKMFLYMLNFANLNHSEVIRGFVINAVDFPKIGHAWIKIGDKYYDPTFDDPIGQTTTKKYGEYTFFGLPYDLFYTNRYSFEKTPSFLKEKSLSYREEFVMKRISTMVVKYKDSGYNLLKPYILRLEYGIDLEKKLDVEDLKKIIPYYEVENFKFIKNGIQKNIKTLKYYNIDTSTIDSLVKQLNFNFDGYYLFKWKPENGDYEYRLGYEVKFY